MNERAYTWNFPLLPDAEVLTPTGHKGWVRTTKRERKLIEQGRKDHVDVLGTDGRVRRYAIDVLVAWCEDQENDQIDDCLAQCEDRTNEPKLCIDCRHHNYAPSPPGVDPHNCLRPDDNRPVNLVTGVVCPTRTWKCHAERTDTASFACGPKGQYWEPKR